jgi:hypothetical protein
MQQPQHGDEEKDSRNQQQNDGSEKSHAGDI